MTSMNQFDKPPKINEPESVAEEWKAGINEILDSAKEEIAQAVLRYNEDLKKIPAGVYVKEMFKRRKREIEETLIEKLKKLEENL